MAQRVTQNLFALYDSDHCYYCVCDDLILFLTANLLVEYTHSITPCNIKMNNFLPETLCDPFALLHHMFEEDDEEEEERRKRKQRDEVMMLQMELALLLLESESPQPMPKQVRTCSCRKDWSLQAIDKDGKVNA